MRWVYKTVGVFAGRGKPPIARFSLYNPRTPRQPRFLWSKNRSTSRSCSCSPAFDLVRVCLLDGNRLQLLYLSQEPAYSWHHRRPQMDTPYPSFGRWPYRSLLDGARVTRLPRAAATLVPSETPGTQIKGDENAHRSLVFVTTVNWGVTESARGDSFQDTVTAQPCNRGTK